MGNSIYPALPGLGFGNTKAPTFKTTVHRSVSGMEARVAHMAYPLWEFSLTYDALRVDASHTEVQTLLGFFAARQGSFDSFLYSDPSDNTVTGQSIGSGTGALTTFQLVRTYGGFTEPVHNVNGTPQIYVAGVLKTAGTDYTISATGLVTFAVAPANGAAITATFGYYYRCRFQNDVAQFSQFMQNLWEAKQVSFVGSTLNKL